jgi:ParB-like chromosome segregation protein Spo0J
MMIVNAELTSHPAANIFPQMNRTDYEALRADIVTNGLREKIVICKDQILDGRHRYRACLEAGIEPGFMHWEGDDPVRFVLSMNLHRRHLSPSQRAMIAAELATSKRGGDRSKAQNCALTHAQAAEQFGVSERQVDKGSALLKAEASGRAATELVEQVRSGKIPLSKAEKLVHLPTEQQREVVLQNNRGNNVRPGTPEQRQSWARQFDEMASQAERMCARMADLIARAEKEGELTPERRERLVEACHNAPRWLFVETEQPEEIPEPRYSMPFKDA